MMNQKLFNVLMFTTGAAIGSLVTWKIMKVRCERIIQEEVDAFKEGWVNLTRESGVDYKVNNDDNDDDEEEELDEDDEDPAMTEYHRIVNRYRNYGEEGGNGDEDEVPYVNGPRLITPEEFGDNPDHGNYCLSYYADGILADDWDETYDVEETIGEDALEHFGDHVDDVVHIRNERLSADYEVTKDPRTFAEAVAGKSPMSYHAD